MSLGVKDLRVVLGLEETEPTLEMGALWNNMVDNQCLGIERLNILWDPPLTRSQGSSIGCISVKQGPSSPGHGL